MLRFLANRDSQKVFSYKIKQFVKFYDLNKKFDSYYKPRSHLTEL